ncbi:MAG: NifU family protein [Crocinitomicaceae bacterium]|nr:NifU family protein [Crocinitomicaceae bacterium]
MDKKNNQILKKKVDLAINQLRPFLNDDGGDIELIQIDEKKHAKLRLLGACKDCSMSITTKAGIKKAITQAVPEIQGVSIIEED